MPVLKDYPCINSNTRLISADLCIHFLLYRLIEASKLQKNDQSSALRLWWVSSTPSGENFQSYQIGFITYADKKHDAIRTALPASSAVVVSPNNE